MNYTLKNGVLTVIALVKAEAVDVFSIKVTKNGGIQPAKAICEYAAANGIQVFFNSMIEEGITQAASLHIGATCSNIVSSIGHAYFSPNRLDGDISTYHTFIHPEQGLVEVPNGPGLGIALDEAAVEKYRAETVIVE